MTTKDADPRPDLIPPDLRHRINSIIEDTNGSHGAPSKPPKGFPHPAPSIGDYEPSDDEQKEAREQEHEEMEEKEWTPIKHDPTRANLGMSLKSSRYLESYPEQAKYLLEWIADLTKKEGTEVSVKTGPFTLRLPGAKAMENNGCLSVVVPSASSFGLEMPPGTEVRVVYGSKDVTALYMVRLFEESNLPFQILIFLVQSGGD